MDTENQIKLLEGLDVWHTKPVEGLKPLLMTDGPHGIRLQVDMHDTIGVKGSVKTTCYPTASLVACSFDRNLLKKLGTNIAKEAKHFGVHMVLGPGINIKRTPLAGRNFEYFSEDPYLSGELGAAYVRSIEDQGVGTSVKHFICNNQETHRYTIDSIVDERALHEIYYKGFKRVIEEKPASVMASYNKMNGSYMTEHPILKSILRNKWRYDGVILSDWGSIHDKVSSVKNSLDLEMPSSYGYWNQHIFKHIKDDVLLSHGVSQSANRIQNLVLKYAIDQKAEIDFDKQHDQARIIARESMVLAKNNQLLPLNDKEKIAIISGFNDHFRYQGGGSSHINSYKVLEIEDIKNNFSSLIKTAKGFHIEHDKMDLKLEKEALEIANESKKVVYIVGVPEQLETEGLDRKTLDLPINQVALYQKLKAINPNIILVVLSGSVVNLAPFEDAKSVLLAYLGGQASACAVMDILFGKVNPSGRLAETWIDDINTCNVQISKDNNAIYYDESIFVGYRYYETFKKQVRYHFGHGLSYTKFQYSNFKLEKNKTTYHVSVDVKNIGKMMGKEVVMLFIAKNNSSVFKAKRTLKRFEKIELKPDETKTVHFELHKNDFAYYDIYQERDVVETGDYQIEVCKNSGLVIDEIDIHVDGKDIKHTLLSYNQYEYNTQDFPKIYQDILPSKHVKRKRPFTLSSTLNDAEGTLVGKLIAKRLKSIAKNEAKKGHDPAMKEVIKQSMMGTPIRMLALFSNQILTLRQAEGLVDILNLKIYKGIKKIRNQHNKKPNQS